MFTDGFADQFGGSNGKKYKIKHSALDTQSMLFELKCENSYGLHEICIILENNGLKLNKRFKNLNFSLRFIQSTFSELEDDTKITKSYL